MFSAFPISKHSEVSLSKKGFPVMKTFPAKLFVVSSSIYNVIEVTRLYCYWLIFSSKTTKKILTSWYCSILKNVLPRKSFL